jgi:arylamine N-acetyltransferase
MQKLRLAWRGWQRRREEAEREFVAKNAAWGAQAQPLTPGPLPASGARETDLEGLQVAYLDDSGLINYFYDTENDEVVEARDGETYAEPRYRRVPRRSAASDAADQREFVATLEDSAMKTALRSAKDPAEFRRVLSEDRKLERAWYVFKNDRATAAIESWLRPPSSRA